MTTLAPILLCTDLDRTLIPNGTQTESVLARPLLRYLANQASVTIVYVSGRSLTLLQTAIDDYGLPVPAYAVGDVGTSIYQVGRDGWRLDHVWQDEIAADFNGFDGPALHAWLRDMPALQLQEPDKQNRFKLSYYTPMDQEPEPVCGLIEGRLRAHGVAASVIFSRDDMNQIGLVDVVPKRATKYHAVEYLIGTLGFARERAVFAGDSGNDLPVLVSGLQAILVANADVKVQDTVRQAIEQQNQLDRQVYFARGGLRGMNGNYAAGVLEGVGYFFPEYLALLENAPLS